jgi:hypothetical protein
MTTLSGSPQRSEYLQGSLPPIARFVGSNLMQHSQ